jgi:DNA repair protein RecN (Recombination protein N)
MLERLSLRDFVIVTSLEVEFGAGFAVLTGETGAGKSILIDALQLALGGRADAGVVREGATRTEIAAEFSRIPPQAQQWLEHNGFAAEEVLLLRRTVDHQGRSRAWINGSTATQGQLRELGEWLLDIHGQHAWQSLTRPAALRALLDDHAGLDNRELARRWSLWQAARLRLAEARRLGDARENERERLAWQIAELDRLAPGDQEWPELNAEHQKLAHAQSILDALQLALDCLSESEISASHLTSPGHGCTDVGLGLRPGAAKCNRGAAGSTGTPGRRDPQPERGVASHRTGP